MSELQLREGELERIQLKHPGKVPIFISKSDFSKDSLPQIQRRKFLVATQYTMGEFVLSIRKWLLLTPEQAIFIFIENVLPPTNASIGEMYEKYKGKDGVLRITYASENTFG